MKVEDKVEKLAKILSEVHGSCYSPFYESMNNEETSDPYKYSWEELEEKAENPSDVDKKFFRDMAKHILSELGL